MARVPEIVELIILIPRTDTASLAGLVSHLSELAADFSDLVPECDLNPVLIREGSGDVRVVDALFVAAGGEPLTLSSAELLDQ